MVQAASVDALLAEVMGVLDEALAEAAEDTISRSQLKAVRIAVQQAQGAADDRSECRRRVMAAMSMAEHTQQWCRNGLVSAQASKAIWEVAGKLQAVYQELRPG